MGMAAGQARLLSITSRMSDNELRAQLINNDKMRLATKSAQVSDAYVQALNDTQMMFTNYDADNNTSYQQLTYNSLTAFNPYNNQYAISNSSGQVLVSEKDAKNFQTADGDLNKFLGLYGLEQSTTYFDNLKDSYDFGDGTIGYNTGNVLSDGTVEYKSTGYNAEELEAMYFGGTLIKTDENGQEITEIYNGYFNTLASADYYNYNKALSNFNESYDTYCATLAQAMEKELETMTNTNGKTLENLRTQLKTFNDTSNVEDVKAFLSEITNFLTVAQGYANTSGREYFTDAIETVEVAGKGETTYPAGGFGLDGGTSEYIYKYDNTSNRLSIAVDAEYDEETGKYNTVKNPNQTNNPPVYNYVISYGSSGFTLTAYVTEGETKLDSDGNPIKDAEGKIEIDNSNVGKSYGAKTVNTTKNIDGVEYYEFVIPANSEYDTEEKTIRIPASVLEPMKSSNAPEADKISLTEVNEPDVTSMLSVAEQVLDSLENSIYTVWDTENEKFKPKNPASGGNEIRWNAYQNCCEAANELYKTIFGYDLSGNIDGWFAILQDPDTLWEQIKTDFAAGNITKAKYQAFKNIYEVITLDRVMNTYGEPKTAWIDKSNVTDSYNENGDAKAQWYTNLFTRMQKGYKVLQDGLASSPEWIKFAFESGLVTLEQVDSKFAWNTVIYSNCSDITEQTNSEAVAIAEAEYNAAMNKIENKDKMYDLELKNIDTEHNSLETEYESIKTAIDKNVERTFKIYS